MGFKRTVRLQLEKMLGRQGYRLVRNTQLEQLAVVNDENHTPFNKQDFLNRDENKITLGWIIPPPGKGSGGHRTIFRTIDILSKMGISHDIYVCDGHDGDPSIDWKGLVKEYYGFDLGDNNIYHNAKNMSYHDGIVATSWYTAYVANNFDNCISKFYFVQDFEPMFYAMGGEYLLAENTYKLNFRGITAGHWLDVKLKEEYGMSTCGFGFSYERDFYKPHTKNDDKDRILYYVRPATERRAFELGILALELLKRRMPEVEIVMVGNSMEGYNIPFDFVDKGIVPFDKLSEIYGQCDMCLVLSTTNLSLLPMEVMASGSVCVSNRGANNEWLVNPDNAILVENEPKNIADNLEFFLKHKDLLEEKRQAGMEYANQFTWEGELKDVYDYILVSVAADKKKYEDK